MTVGIDFDNTIVNTAEVSKKYLDIFKPNNNLKNFHELPPNEKRIFFNKYKLEITNNSLLNSGVKEAFRFFKDNNIKTILITARSDAKQIKATRKYLKKHGIIFDSLCFNNKVKDKVCVDNNVDLMIDDTENVLETVSHKGIKVLKYGTKSEKINSVKDWFEIIELIRKEIQ